MNIKELKEKIKDLPDDMTVVTWQDESADLRIMHEVEMKEVFPHRSYGFNISSLNNEEKVKVCIIS